MKDWNYLGKSGFHCLSLVNEVNEILNNHFPLREIWKQQKYFRKT